jgi:translational activator of cytochrome c oxidase 1
MNGICVLLRKPLFLKCARIVVSQERYAGHSKWQNIRHIKGSNDQKKSQLINKYCFAIRRAVGVGGSIDPKINDKLAQVITSALKASVPKETINRTLDRAKNVKLRKELIEASGPGGCFMLLDVETDNISRTRHDLKKIFRKVKGTTACGIIHEGAARHAFEERGVIRLKKKVEGTGDISFEKLEEIAIEIGAEEVVEDDEDPETVWTLLTSPMDLMKVKGELEKALPGVEVLDTEPRFLPIVQVGLSDTDIDIAAELCNTLQELDEVNSVYTNIA